MFRHYLQSYESVKFICTFIYAATADVSCAPCYMFHMYLTRFYFALQYMFVPLVLPCLVLAHLEQVVFLIANPKSSE
jgi:multisubunit Na+/H+ antiporter MnhE subunit